MITRFNSPTYNRIFDSLTGTLVRWGKTLDDNPSLCPDGPEILDMEISTICSKGCSFCYKDNKIEGKNMSIDTFKRIIDLMPKTLTQIAFGIGDINANPDLNKILLYTRQKNIVPNITINGYDMSLDNYSSLAGRCGSVAVSNYNIEHTMEVVHQLYEHGCNQVNIHQVLTSDSVPSIISDLLTIAKHKHKDNIHSFVFLLLKPKGRANALRPRVSSSQILTLWSLTQKLGIPLGFDSCSSPLVLTVIKDTPEYTKNIQVIEPCESFLFSAYCNVIGDFYPCSFTEGTTEWTTGLQLKDNFINDIWNSDRAIQWRTNLTTNQCKNCTVSKDCRACPIYEINTCKEQT